MSYYERKLAAMSHEDLARECHIILDSLAHAKHYLDRRTLRQCEALCRSACQDRGREDLFTGALAKVKADLAEEQRRNWEAAKNL